MSTAKKIRWAVRGVLVLAIVTLLVYRAGQKPKAHGLMVRTITTECNLSRNDAYRDLLLRISTDHQTWINLDAVDSATLQGRLHDIFKVRAKPVLFLDASDELSFQQVADIIGRSSASTPDLKVILLTHKARSRCEELWSRTSRGGAQ